MAKQIKFNINEGIDFFAHETSVQFSPTQFILDFKSITPRIDPRSQQEAVYSLKHNVVLMDVYHAAQFHALLEKMLAKYQTEFGKITKPKPVQKMEKKQSKKKITKEKIISPAYLG